MAKGIRRTKALAAKASRKKHALSHPAGQSHYGRKKQYCDRNDVFGFQVPEPKPWR